MEERILIVDDDITFALMLRTWLSKRGFGVGTASSVAAVTSQAPPVPRALGGERKNVRSSSDSGRAKPRPR
jgi:ActR/RegA family two-component response regulator